MNVPIIKLEVERMKYSILTALSTHAVEMDSMVQAAVEAFCTEDNLHRIVREAVMQELNAAVREEVRNFFRCSAPGRQAVREAVIEHLNRQDEFWGSAV